MQGGVLEACHLLLFYYSGATREGLDGIPICTFCSPPLLPTRL